MSFGVQVKPLTQEQRQAAIADRIKEQEAKDFFVLRRLLAETFETMEGITDVKFKQMDRYSHYDVIMTFKENGVAKRWAFELKERNKTWQQCLDYPNVELKTKKYNYIRKATHDFRDFDRVYYIQLLNESRAYVFNLGNIDIREMPIVMMTQKYINTLDNSPMVQLPIYQLPLSKAIVFKDLEKYYKEYAIHLQATQEERQQAQER